MQHLSGYYKRLASCLVVPRKANSSRLFFPYLTFPRLGSQRETDSAYKFCTIMSTPSEFQVPSPCFVSLPALTCCTTSLIDYQIGYLQRYLCLKRTAGLGSGPTAYSIAPLISPRLQHPTYSIPTSCGDRWYTLHAPRSALPKYTSPKALLSQSICIRAADNLYISNCAT